MKIINVMASSLDGCIASAAKESDKERQAYQLTSAKDQEHVKRLILEADAIITGAESVRASQVLRSEKNSSGKYPLWVILTKKGLDRELRFWQQNEHERWLVSPQKVKCYNPAVENLVFGNKHPATFIVEMLKAKKVKTALLFGGGQVNALFYAAGLVNELYLTLSPVIIGSQQARSFFDARQVANNLPHPQTLTLKNMERSESHIFLHYLVNH